MRENIIGIVLEEILISLSFILDFLIGRDDENLRLVTLSIEIVESKGKRKSFQQRI